LTTTNRLIDR